MVLMIIVILAVLGLCLGSFVNALVWRLHEQETSAGKAKKPDKRYQDRLSITKGRSMCPHCHRELATKDLVPVWSWLVLGGKCRYCAKPISWQYPLMELLTAGLFVFSYLFWPASLTEEGIAGILQFGLWLALLTGLLALLVYDMRWMLLPNRIMYPLGAVACLWGFIGVVTAEQPLVALINLILAIIVGGGIFYVLFQVSKGRWIGGGDVKLGWLLGLVAGTPSRSLLFIFVGSLLGSLVSLPLLASKRLKRSSTIPFGPLLIAGAFIVQLFGDNILQWYREVFLRIG